MPASPNRAPAAIPVDLDHPKRRERARRSARLAISVARHLGPVLARKARGRPVGQRDFAPPLRRVFDDLGATFLKYGQLIASAPTLFGDEMAAEFRSTLDTGPPMGLAEVRAAVFAEFGRHPEDMFATFDPEPLGQASLAVVHRAVTHDGRVAAVKVLRPGIEETIATDLALMERLFRVVAASSPTWAARCPISSKSSGSSCPKSSTCATKRRSCSTSENCRAAATYPSSWSPSRTSSCPAGEC